MSLSSIFKICEMFAWKYDINILTDGELMLLCKIRKLQIPWISESMIETQSSRIFFLLHPALGNVFASYFLGKSICSNTHRSPPRSNGKWVPGNQQTIKKERYRLNMLQITTYVPEREAILARNLT